MLCILNVSIEVVLFRRDAVRSPRNQCLKAAVSCSAAGLADAQEAAAVASNRRLLPPRLCSGIVRKLPLKGWISTKRGEQTDECMHVPARPVQDKFVYRNLLGIECRKVSFARIVASTVRARLLLREASGPRTLCQETTKNNSQKSAESVTRCPREIPLGSTRDTAKYTLGDMLACSRGGGRAYPPVSEHAQHLGSKMLEARVASGVSHVAWLRQDGSSPAWIWPTSFGFGPTSAKLGLHSTGFSRTSCKVGPTQLGPMPTGVGPKSAKFV